jgi:HlyD family secretion protein
MKKIIIISLAVIGLGAAGFFLLGKHGSSATIQWETKPIERGNMSIEITATGTLEAVTEIEVGTQVSGKIEKIFVDYNSKVRKGQVVALIDTVTLAQQVFDAEAALYRQQVGLDQAQREYDRIKKLFEEKVVAEVEYETALNSLETAKSNVLSAKTQLKRAHTNLEYATIYAPIDGVVISKSVEVGQTVAASFNAPVLFKIVNDLTKMQVVSSIDEADIGNVKENQAVTFTVDAYPDDKFTGTVKQIRIEPIIVSNVVTYNVIIDVPNPDLKLMPGMTANVNILVDDRKDVLKAPSKALSFTPPDFYLKGMYASLPDSTKQSMEKRMSQIRERMLSMGVSETDVNQRLEQMKYRMAFSGMQNAPGTFPGGSRPGMMPGMGTMSGQGTGGNTQGSASNLRKSFGQVWIKEGDNIRVMPVRTGLSDGSSVEIMSGQLKEGTEVIIAANYDEEAVAKKTTQTQSPFMPTPPRGRRGF